MSLHSGIARGARESQSRMNCVAINPKPTTRSRRLCAASNGNCQFLRLIRKASVEAGKHSNRSDAWNVSSYQKNKIGEPLRRRLRIGPSPGEMRVDAKAEAVGASPFVESSGGRGGNRVPVSARHCGSAAAHANSSRTVVLPPELTVAFRKNALASCSVNSTCRSSVSPGRTMLRNLVLF